MYGSEEHYENREIYFYVRGLVSIETSDRMEEHMCNCDECLLKTVHLRHTMIEACANASRLFEGYFDKTLEKYKSGFIEAHLISCDPCADEYGALVYSKIENVGV